MSAPLDDRLRAAIADGGVRAPDPRGLMPLEEARAILRGATAFVKGEGQDVDGRYVLASDVLWAALLSLEDGAELVAVASRLDWQFSPRGFENIDLVRRYGDAIVPWLATRVDADGTLHNVPWCVLPCLLACGDAAAFALAWRVARVGAGGEPVARAWIDRHPAVAIAALRARLDQPMARAHLAGLRLRGQGAALDAAGAPSPDVLAHLDACALGLTGQRTLTWPALGGTGTSTPHGFRAIAARSGDAWGLAIERVEGDRGTGVRAARVAVYAYGSQVPAGARQLTRPLALAGAPAAREAFLAWVAAAELDALTGPPAASLAAMGLPADATIVATVPHLAHVAPPDLPSGSPVFQALARALAG